MCYRVITMSNMPLSPTPGSSHHLAFIGDDYIDFHLQKNIVLPTRSLSAFEAYPVNGT